MSDSRIAAACTRLRLWHGVTLIALVVIGLLGQPLAADDDLPDPRPLTEPRIHPLDRADANEAQKRVLGDSERPLNIFGTIAHHETLAEKWLVFGRYVLSESTLPARDREILILRIGWLLQAEYEWGQHARIGRRVGLSDEEILRVAEGPEAKGWSAHERALLRATDQLRSDAFIDDDTWSELDKTYSTEQMMDLVFTVGQYNLVSMALRTFGVQREDGVEGLPEP